MDQFIRTNLDAIQSAGKDTQGVAFQAILAVTHEPVDWAYEVWDELLAGFRGRLRASGTQVVPGGIFDVGGIDGAMAFKLALAVGEAAGVIERDSPLPEVRGGGGIELNEAIEILERLVDLACLKAFHAPGQQF